MDSMRCDRVSSCWIRSLFLPSLTVKVTYTSICIICIAHRLMHSRDHLSYGITQCYLQPGRGDSPDFTLAFTTHQYSFCHPSEVEGWVDLGTAVRVHNPCPRLYNAVVVVINTRPRWAWALILGPNTAVERLTTRPLRSVTPSLWVGSLGPDTFLCILSINLHLLTV